jgi:hypothetical protein
MQLALREMPARRARPASCPKKASRTSGRGPDRKKPYSRTLCRALPCPHLFGRGPKKCLHLLPTVFLRNSTERVDPPLRLFYQLILRSLRQELSGNDRGTNLPAVAGRLFF